MSDSKKVQVVIELDELIYKVLKDYTPVQSCCTENARLVLAVKEGILLTDGDLISREYLEDAFDNLCCHNCKMCRNFRIEDSFYKCALIDNAPTIRKEKLK